MGMLAQICVINFQPGGNKLLGLFGNGDAGSNLRKQFSAGGRSVIGTLRKLGCRLKSAQAIFSRGAISYWDFSYIGMPAQICVSKFQPGGNQLLGLFVNGIPAQICVSNSEPGAISYCDFL